MDSEKRNYNLEIVAVRLDEKGDKRSKFLSIRRDNTNLDEIHIYVIKLLNGLCFPVGKDDQRLSLDVGNEPDKDGRLPVTVNWNPDNLSLDLVPPECGNGRLP